MANDIRKFPPHWCRNAIPSKRGWCHPKTGELLISVPGGVAFEVRPIVETKVDEVTVDVKEAVEKNVELQKEVGKKETPAKTPEVKAEAKEEESKKTRKTSTRKKKEDK